MSKPNVQTRQKFSTMIQQIVVDKQCGYIEAIIEYCSAEEMEVESAAKLLTDGIKQKLAGEAAALNLLK